MAWLGGHLHARFGVARRDITPPAGLRNRTWGAATNDIPAGVHRPIFATALAILPEAGTPRVLVSLDLMEWLDAVDERFVRERILQHAGLREEDLLLHCTHTHSAAAPCTRLADLVGGELAPAYLDAIADRSAQAAQEALRTARDGVLTWGTGAARLAANRDESRDGRRVVGWNPTVDADDTLVVGRVTDTSGAVRVVVVSYACHPTVLGWRNDLLSPDYVGALREEVERAHPGATCLFVQGASGELAPVHQYSADPGQADLAGRALAAGVAATLMLMDPPDHRPAPGAVVESGAPLGLWPTTRVAPERAVRSAILRVALSRRPAPPTTDGDDVPEHVRAERTRRAALVGIAAGESTTIDYPVWVWELGELVLVAHPGEAYSWLAAELRRELSPRTVVVGNLTNGAGAFYLPPADTYEGPGYTTDQTPVAKGSLEAVAAAITRHLGARVPTNDRGEP